MSKGKSKKRMGLICTESLPLDAFALLSRPWERDWHAFAPSPLRVLVMNPRSNQKSSIWSAVAWKRARDLDELLARARDTVIRYWLANTLSLQLSVNHNIECPMSRPMVIVLLSYSCCGVRTYVRTVTWQCKIFEIDWLPKLLKYEVPLRRLRRAGAPLSAYITFSV